MRLAGQSVLGCLLVVVAGCGCGDGEDQVFPDPVAMISVSGSVSYERYLPQAAGGLDYDDPEIMPVRGATVRILDQDGDQVSRTVIDEFGDFTGLTAPAGEPYTVEILAQLGDPDDPNVVVLDNTDGGSLYMGSAAISGSTFNSNHNILLEGGWNGASYDERSAAPFAVLDTIYDAQAFVTSHRPDFDFVRLPVYWSPNNVPSTAWNPTVGEIITSNYSVGSLWILGGADIDTDEYDRAIVAHEWVHYFEDNHSRTDSLGGNHGLGDILDDTLAFSEGIATALSGMINGDGLYIDTGGVAQADVFLFQDMEGDLVPDTDVRSEDGRLLDGYWSEFSIVEVLWDIYDSPSVDDDVIGLGGGPLLDTMLGGQITTPYFISMYTFLFHLKALPIIDAATADAIDTIAASENIYFGNEYEATDPATPLGYRRYNELTDDGTLLTLDMDGNTLQTRLTYAQTPAEQDGNELFTRIFFRGRATTAGSHTIKAWPTDTNLTMGIVRPGDDPFVPQELIGPYEWTVNLEAGELLVFSVTWDRGVAADDFDIGWFAPGVMVPKVSN